MSRKGAKVEIVDPLVLDLTAYLRHHRRRSELTIDAYVRDIHEFGAWLDKLPATQSPMGRTYESLRTATSTHINRYLI
ncbi:MAG: site-specific integrase [Candidatus Eremiobacteraeota bacterium]|nr:site-specific integrase [Candidatus Eremiobacteraeota bacterium]